MFTIPPRSRNYARLLSLILVLIMSCPLSGCADRLVASPPTILTSSPQPVATGKLAEVSPPSLIQELRRSLDQYQPQVKILNPQPEEILDDTTVSVQLAIQDLPIFQNPDLEMGTHLHLILDNEPYQAVYEINKPIIFNNLTPGTHSLRVFASRPWHESFKNDGAFAQTTFHVLTKTEDNRPNPELPLLTYSRPKGSYGAEPILLDFYLTNAPLHVVAQESSKDAIADWRIRVTINNESFILDNWQPVYLTGFEKGKNWVKLEFIDEQGNLVQNVFNNTVRVIDYNPNGQDTLSKLVRGELSLEVAKSMINPNISVPTNTEKPELKLIESVEEIEKPTTDSSQAIEPITEKIESLTTETENLPVEILIPSKSQISTPTNSELPVISQPDLAPELNTVENSSTPKTSQSLVPEQESMPDPSSALPSKQSSLTEIPSDFE